MSTLLNDSEADKLIAVLIIEDDSMMRRHFERVIAEHPRLTLFGSAGDCKAGLKLLQKRPDVMLVDLGLPDGNGMSLIRELKSVYPSSEAIVVSIFTEEEKVVGAIRAGASGYLLKDMPTEDIGASIIDVFQGGSPINPSIARYILRAVSGRREDSDEEKQPAAELSAREIEVLNLIARGYSRREIASILALSTHTVVTHVRHIYEKLEVHSRNEAVFEACQQGLITIHG